MPFAALMASADFATSGDRTTKGLIAGKVPGGRRFRLELILQSIGSGNVATARVRREGAESG
jgi:hypothetical protein